MHQQTQRRRSSWLLGLVLTVLALVAFLAPIGQAHPALDRSSDEVSIRAAQKDAERAQRGAERRAQREAEHPLPKKLGRGTERENGVVLISCNEVNWTFRNFPEGHNVVTEKLRIGHGPYEISTFEFDGSTGTDVTAIKAPPGKYQIDAWGKWNMPGFRGAFDIHAKVNCASQPSLSIDKLQKLDGGAGEFTTSQLSGEVGETIDYEILLSNTGNVPLTLSSFSDPHCDAGTITEPASETLAVGASATYTCKHLLSKTDQTAGSYANTVTVEATPPDGQGGPISETSNTVITQIPPPVKPPEEPEPKEKEAPKDPGTTTTTTGGSNPPGTTGVSTSQTSQSGVLAFVSATVPTMNGPQGCVRANFHVSIKSAGVSSTVFYLDGHKLKTLTSKNVRKGLLTLMVNPSKLTLGTHKLMAKITMGKTATTKVTRGTRTVKVLRCSSSLLVPKFTG